MCMGVGYSTTLSFLSLGVQSQEEGEWICRYVDLVALPTESLQPNLMEKRQRERDLNIFLVSKYTDCLSGR